MGRIKTAFRLTGKSFSVLRNDGSLVLFPFISGAATVFLLLILWGPALGLGVVDTAGSSGQSLNAAGWVLIAVSSYLATSVAVFCNVGLASCVSRSLSGQDTSLSEGFRVAWSRRRQILAWAFIATVVSLIIRAIQERAGFLGAILGALGGLAWNLATLFVVPILALEGVGPVDALKLSVNTFRKRWGEGLVGNALIGVVCALGVFVAMVLVTPAVIFVSNTALLVAWVALCLVCLVAFCAVMAALGQVFNTALYIYSRDGSVAGPFTEAEFQAAFRPKKKRL